MVIFKTIVLLVIISNKVKATDCKTQGKIETAPAIIDGKLVKKSEWPWMVSIKVHHNDQTFNCGGSLIHPSWVLTAAHCLYSNNLGSLLPKEAFRVLIGAIDIVNGRNEGFQSRVAYYVKNPKFIMQAVEKKNNDIALLKLVRPVPKAFAKTIPLGGINTPSVGDRCIAMGWGCDHNSKTPVTTSKLFHVVLPVLPITQCSKKFQELINGNQRTKICAGYFNRTMGICSGDSGGPLVCRKNQKWVLSGIISFTIEKAPAVFTRVASFKKWIMSVINKNDMITRRQIGKSHRLLANYFRNRMVALPSKLHGYPLSNYVLYARLVPYLNLKNYFERIV